MHFSTLFSKLQNRGFVKDCTHDLSILNNSRPTFYVGFDLTGPSLHIGHLMSLILSKQILSHDKNSYGIFILGGGTTRIGDPSGKTSSRPMLSEEEIASNKTKIAQNIIKIVSGNNVHQSDLNLHSEIVFKGPNFVVLDNWFWLKDIKYIDFLSTYGRLFSINQMVGMEIVKTRLDSNSNLTFLEFNYSLLQAYDFLYLNQKYNCNIQIGGSDQWSNILQGINLINKTENKDAVGITMPLLTKYDGSKMGKSESGTVWITESMTSSFDLFQYIRNTADADVEKFLLLFTNYSSEEIGNMISSNINQAKEILALEIVTICHSAKHAQDSVELSQQMFSGKASVQEALLATNIPCPLDELLTGLNIVSSKSEVKRLCETGGLYIQNKTISNPKQIINAQLIFELDPDSVQKNGSVYFIVSVGKKKRFSICAPINIE